MDMDSKKVIIPLEEYEALLKDREALAEAIKELKKDCKERGLYVEYVIQHFSWYNADSFSNADYAEACLHIMSKEEVLSAAQNEINRLSTLAKDLVNENEKLKNRNLWGRIFNKK